MNKTTHSVLVRLTIPVAAVLAAVTLTASPAAAKKSDCPSGAFCVWDGLNYGGHIQRISTTRQYVKITLTATKSYYNNRTQRTYHHRTTDGQGDFVCISAGASGNFTSGWQAAAKSAYLSTSTGC